MRLANQKSPLINVIRASTFFLKQSALAIAVAASLLPWSLPPSLSNAAPCNAGLNSVTNSDVKLDTVNSSLESRPDRHLKTRIDSEYGKLPLSFEANQGQEDSRVRFIAHGMGYDLRLAQTGVLLTFAAGDSRRSPLRMRLIGGNRNARAAGLDELPGKCNYFIGNDPDKWRTGVATYARVKYENAYPGVDLVLYGNQRELEYDFIVAPGASFRSIRLAFDGALRVRLDDEGNIVIETPVGEMRHRKPVVYQLKNGVKLPVVATYVLNNSCEVSFEIAAHDPSQPLIIDPVLSYSSYLDAGEIRRVAVDAVGDAYLAGTVPFDSFGGTSIAFVKKLNRGGGALLYSVFLGGNDQMPTSGIRNQAFGIAVDSNGGAYVTGSTNSKDFPTTTGAFQTALPGPQGKTAGFITRLSPGGDALVYSTYLGGVDDFASSSIAAIALDRTGSAYVTGSTNSEKFPTINPAQAVNPGGGCISGDTAFICNREAFVSKLNPSGSALTYSTYLGGPGDDDGKDIAVDATASAYVVGTTSAHTFPTTNAFQQQRSGGSDLFVAKLNAGGSEFVYSTLLGGGGSETGAGVAVDSSGNAYVTGSTSSNDFPTTAGALQTVNSNCTLFKSTNAGANWSAIHGGLPSSTSLVKQVEFDPLDPTALYVNTIDGFFKSTDRGNSFRRLSVPTFNSIVGLARFAIDPTNSLTMYAGTDVGPFSSLQKSTDGGNSWFSIGLNAGPAISILIDRKDPTTLYAAFEFGNPGVVAAIFKSTDGGINWAPAEKRISHGPVSALALSPSKPKKLYAVSGGSVYLSANRAKKWSLGGFSSSGNRADLAVDPKTANTLYLAAQTGVYKSTDGGETFRATSLTTSVGALTIDPRNTSIIYAAARQLGPNKVFKSTDGGASWVTTSTGITSDLVRALAIDPNDTSVIYAGTISGGDDAFVAKINTTGTALVYSTYLGGTRDDRANAIAVDGQGNVYVTGQTSSFDFPIESAMQSQKLGSPTSYDAVLINLDEVGGLIFSTYLGGSDDDIGWSIALDTSGGMYIAGSTTSDDFPLLNPLQPARNGPSSNGFVTKF